MNGEDTMFGVNFTDGRIKGYGTGPMMGQVSSWIFPTSIHPLSIGIGSLNKKPAIFEDTIQKRSVLHLTIAIDHDVIDGMPARRFVEDLVNRLEAGAGLE